MVRYNLAVRYIFSICKYMYYIDKYQNEYKLLIHNCVDLLNSNVQHSENYTFLSLKSW